MTVVYYVLFSMLEYLSVIFYRFPFQVFSMDKEIFICYDQSQRPAVGEKMTDEIELTILMPCLNEEETIGACISKAQQFLKNYQIAGEILIADNASTDKSAEIAQKMGARVVHVEKKGYGSALICGTQNARGKYVIMGDADDSYDFLHLEGFVEKLRAGYDLVMGDRFAGGIEKGAMPWLHKYVGNPILSAIGRLFFNSKIKDFHCGLRGYNKKSIEKLGLQTAGMEYASEMVVKAELYHLKITQIPTVLRKDGRSHKPHLRSFRDGWRHLKFLYIYTPDWLYLYPGIFLTICGGIGSMFLLAGPVQIGDVVFSIHTLLYCIFAAIIGVNIILLFLFSKIYASTNNFLPVSRFTEKMIHIKEDYFIFGGILLFVIGFAVGLTALSAWSETGYHNLVPEKMVRLVLLSAFLMEIGLQFAFSGFFIGILKINNIKKPPVR